MLNHVQFCSTPISNACILSIHEVNFERNENLIICLIFMMMRSYSVYIFAILYFFSLFALIKIGWEKKRREEKFQCDSYEYLSPMIYKEILNIKWKHISVLLSRILFFLFKKFMPKYCDALFYLTLHFYYHPTFSHALALTLSVFWWLTVRKAVQKKWDDEKNFKL